MFLPFCVFSGHSIIFSAGDFSCVLSIIFSLGWQFIRLDKGSSSRRRAGLLGQDPLFPFFHPGEMTICPLSPHRFERRSTVLLENSSCQIHCVGHVLTNALRYSDMPAACQGQGPWGGSWFSHNTSQKSCEVSALSPFRYADTGLRGGEFHPDSQSKGKDWLRWLATNVGIFSLSVSCQVGVGEKSPLGFDPSFLITWTWISFGFN